MQLSNENIAIQIATHGAELTSLIAHGAEHIWQADPVFWKRHAPILFPIVGKVYNNTYRVDGQDYHLPQHGFARDSEFQVVQQSSTHAKLSLASSPETMAKYPYPFVLTADYQLCGDTVICQWTVENPADSDMYFQIGAHPAFFHRDFNPADHIYGYMQFFSQGQPVSQLIVNELSEKGHALPSSHNLRLTSDLLPFTPTLFDHDALVLENAQTDRVLMLDKQQNPYLEMTFDAPVLGIWSPCQAPFCCIEPWYGRTDAEGFAGDISQRQHIQHLASHSSFTFKYTIRAINSNSLC